MEDGWAQYRRVPKGPLPWHRTWALPLPRAGRGLRGCSRIPHSGRTNKAPFDGGTCPAWGTEPGEVMRPPLATTTLTRGEGLGGRTWEEQGAPGARAGARAGGGGAQVRRPEGGLQAALVRPAAAASPTRAPRLRRRGR